jgi:hypothetical protein
MWMKIRLCIFLLAASLAAYAQGRSGGAAGGVHMGGPASGTGSMGASHGNEGSSMGKASRPSDMGKQSPDTILSHNTKLSSKLDSLLPKGLTAQQACSGFKNLGQCVAAIHVSHNLGIPFDEMKAKMTGAGSESLGKIIHDLKPDVNAKAEAKKGQKQADQDMSES